MATYLTMMQQIHVLVVDHEPAGLINLAKILDMCQYRVSIVELASAAIAMLSSGKFDIILADINSPDLHGFKLVQQAVNMNIPIIVMSDADNAFIAAKAIENGAFLCVRKPATTDVLMCLWQCVLKNKSKGGIQEERLRAANNLQGAFRVYNVEVEQNPNGTEGHGNLMLNNEEDKGKKKLKGKKVYNEIGESSGNSENSSNKRKAVCTEWTQELHEKFMAAVETLGEGRCFPKDILELMDTPGLTRMQVASHLQKCRNNNWRAPDERKSDNPQPVVALSPENVGGSQGRSRRFGCMPRLRKHSSRGQSSRRTTTTTQLENGGQIVPMPPAPISISHHHQNNYNPNPNPEAGQGEGELGIGGSSNPQQNVNQQAISDDNYFSLQDMDSLIQDFHGISQATSGIIIAPPDDPSQPGPSGYQYDALYFDQIMNGAGSGRTHNWGTSGQSANFGEDNDSDQNRGL